MGKTLWIMWITLCITRKRAKNTEGIQGHLSTGKLLFAVDNVDKSEYRTDIL